MPKAKKEKKTALKPKKVEKAVTSSSSFALPIRRASEDLTPSKEEKKPRLTARGVSFKVPLEELLEAGCHFGHQARRWNPQMASYLYTVRDGIHIFDLAKTQEGLEKACEYVKEIASRKAKIIFVGTKRQAQAIVKEEAQKASMSYVIERWPGGTITNWEQVKKSIEKLQDMREKKAKGEYEKYTKKENILLDREISRLEKFFGGLVGLEELPEAIFVVDINKDVTAVREARRKGIKVVAIVDSNGNPEMIDYVIPSNDDAVRSVTLVVSKIAEAVKSGLPEVTHQPAKEGEKK